MSVAAIPKTAGGRPPFLPPIHTSFDPSPGDSGEPIHTRIADSVNRLIRLIDVTPDEHLATILDLLGQRRIWVESELSAARLLERPSLPPLYLDSAGYDTLIVSDDEVIRLYTRLINDLDEAISQVRLRLMMQRGVDHPSDD